MGDLISLHHKRPPQPCHCNWSHFFVCSILLRSCLLAAHCIGSFCETKLFDIMKEVGIGNEKSMDTVINLGPTPSCLLGFGPSSHRGASGACCVGEKTAPPQGLLRPKEELVAAARCNPRPSGGDHHTGVCGFPILSPPRWAAAWFKVALVHRNMRSRSASRVAVSGISAFTVGFCTGLMAVTTNHIIL